jgi:uncharacterized protein (UPF0548 family)
MFLIRRPSAHTIDLFLSSQQRLGFSYTEVGATRDQTPPGYTVDHNRILLGRGHDPFLRAVQLLQSWAMFDVGWVEVVPPNTPIEANATVAVLVHHAGFWSLNACRVVYVLSEDRSAGFAYGTLQDHAESGEERFSIEWSAQDDTVWYDILAFSRPQQWQARVALPLTRMLQKKFARDSKAAMAKAFLW